MKRLLLAVGALAVAAGAGSAGAYFTSQAAVPENVITAGRVAVSAEPTSAALSVSALAPGVVEWRSLTVVNGGTLAADIVVTGAKKAGFTEMYEALTCRVLDESGRVLYDGKMSSMRTAPVTLQAGARHQLRFGVGLPATAGVSLMGDYVKLTVNVGAEQTR